MEKGHKNQRQKGIFKRTELKFKISKNEKWVIKKWRKRRGFRQLGEVGFAMGKSKRKKHEARVGEKREFRASFLNLVRNADPTRL